ncbi:MAG: hypothetical protein R2771_06250 [Saprospiraceae bacterium]
MGNESNLCGTCHQPRTAPQLVGDDDGNARLQVLTTTSPDDHVTVLYGSGGYEFTGSTDYPTPCLFNSLLQVLYVLNVICILKKVYLQLSFTFLPDEAVKR